MIGIDTGVGDRNLVSAPEAFDLQPIDLFWAGPSLGTSQNDHWPGRPRSGRASVACGVLNHDVQGIAVHIAARISAAATAGEILVSRTVKDLIAGSGLHFKERGAHSLKGLQDTMELYAAPS
jgi:class 3 adenylate cyclase